MLLICTLDDREYSKELVHAKRAYMELWMNAGSLESTSREARVVHGYRLEQHS